MDREGTAEHFSTLEYHRGNTATSLEKILSPNISPLQWVLLTLIFAAAITIRFIGIERMSVFMDEIWVVELAMGRGPVHDELKFNTLYTDVAPPTRLSAAGPALDIFRQVQGITHPPGYVFALRLWCNLFGTSDAATRGLSAVASALAVLVLFDVIRRLYGTRAGLWSALIMALAGPQVELAQEVRPYAMLTLMGLLCADLILVIRSRCAGGRASPPAASTRHPHTAGEDARPPETPGRVEGESLGGADFENSTDAGGENAGAATAHAPHPSLLPQGERGLGRQLVFIPVLALLIFITMVTHYFAVGIMLGLGAYSVFVLRGRARGIALSAFALAAIIFSVAWLPKMLAQRETVARTADTWLKEPPGGHVIRTASRLADVPLRLLIEHEIAHGNLKYTSIGIVIAPFLLLRKRRDLAFLCCWLGGTLGLLLGLDLIRNTRHLELVRYCLFAGPAIYALPAVLVLYSRPWMRVALPALVAFSCLCALPALSDLAKQKYREAGAYLDKHVEKGDVVVIFNYDAEPFYAAFTWLSLAHYSEKYPWPFLMVSGPFDDAVKSQLKDAHAIWVVAPPGRVSPSRVVPDAAPQHIDYFHRFAEIYQMPAPSTTQPTLAPSPGTPGEGRGEGSLTE